MENGLHYVRDVTMGEDACRVRKGAAPQILAGLGNAMLALLKRARCTNVAAALRRHSVHVHEVLRMVGIVEN